MQDLALLSRPKHLRDLPIHRWFVFPHSFGAGLVENVLDHVGVKEGAVLWDPCMGSGTALVVARQRGLLSFGSDILPLSVVVATAKTRRYKSNDVLKALDYMSSSRKVVGDTAINIPFVLRAFPANALAEAESIRQAIEGLPDPALRPFFLTALVAVFAAYGNFRRDGGWPRFEAGRAKDASDMFEDFRARVELMANDIVSETKYFRSGNPRAIVSQQDLRVTTRCSPADIIITSPPYLNRHDYTRLFAPELSLLGLHRNENLIKLRYQSIRSHVEGRAVPSQENLNGYKIPILADITDRVSASAYDGKRSAQLVQGYFTDMLALLRKSHRVLKPGGVLALVISDVRHAGVTIKMTDILEPLARIAGLKANAVWHVRQRGNSSQQMQKYGRQPVDEWLMLWRREH
jgi:DNA modification methylase